MIDRHGLSARIVELDEDLMRNWPSAPADPGIAAQHVSDSNRILARVILTSCMANLAHLEASEASSEAHREQGERLLAVFGTETGSGVAGLVLRLAEWAETLGFRPEATTPAEVDDPNA